MSTTRLGRVAKEALLLIRKFMGQGDLHRASDAALKAAEAFNEIAKHSTGSAHKIAYQRAKTLVKITKVLRRGEPLPMDLVDALDSFYPEESQHPSPPVESDSEENEIEEESVEISEDSKIEPNALGIKAVEASPFQRLNGISIACTLVEMLERASQSIRMFVHQITDVKSVVIGTQNCEVNLLNRLITKANAGVKVQIIICEPEAIEGVSNPNQEAVKRLRQEAPSIEMQVSADIQNKFLVIDEVELLEGSMNFTAEGLSRSDEEATWTNNTEYASQFIRRFDHYWDHQLSE